VREHLPVRVAKNCHAGLVNSGEPAQVDADTALPAQCFMLNDCGELPSC
jgi:hypothetical protein